MSLIYKRKYYKTLFVIMLFLLLMLIFFTSTLGVAKIPFVQAVKIIMSRIPIFKNFVSLNGIRNSFTLIVLKIRLPRIILSALVGMALAGSGVVFQAIFKNPMADPYVIGISSGAAFGATIAIILGLQSSILGLWALNIMAFIGAIGTTIVVYNISRIGNSTPVVTLLLAGIAISFFLSSTISLLMTLKRDQIENIVFWTMGSVAAASWKHIIITMPIVLIGCMVLIIFTRDLNIMLMGEDTAKNLGIEVETLKKILLVLGSIIAASAVAVSGIIGFVGIIVPHIVRLIVGPDHRVLLPFSLLAGAIFLILSDTIARLLIPPIEIPLGVITSLFGAPYFIYLLYKKKKKVF